jgi:hypothetical protein
VPTFADRGLFTVIKYRIGNFIEVLARKLKE